MDFVREMPGIIGAGLSQTDPFDRDFETNRRFSRRLAPPGFGGQVLAVDAGFFNALGTRMIAGRSFSDDDVNQQALVAIVNETGARALFPHVPIPEVIGRTTRTSDGMRRIIGVSTDFRAGIDTRGEPDLFLPVSANETCGSTSTWNAFTVVLGMAPGRVPDGALLARKIHEQPWNLPNLGIVRVEAIQAQFERRVEKPRLLAAVFGTLAGIILVLTTVAVYGLASFEVRRRSDEMTVRLALGATPRALRQRLAGVIVRPLLLGVMVGLPLSWIEVKRERG